MNGSTLPFSAASERNRAPILEALRNRMPTRGRLLEIGAGTGQHAVYMAPVFPGLRWLPTDRQAELPGLQARLDAEGSANIEQARALNILHDPWPAGPFTAAYTANTTHIMSWPEVCAMLDGVSSVLEPCALLFVYGPFNVNGTFTAASNQAFDSQLRARASHMGLRDIGALETQAARHQLCLEERLAMPANNFLLVFRSSENA